MTNNELLQADMLDILFDGRNKDYGAYELRRGYNRRMFLSLVTGLLLIALFILLNSFSKKNSSIVSERGLKDSILFIEGPMIDNTPTKPILRPKNKLIIPPASIKTTVFLIVPDEQLPDSEIPTTEDQEGKLIGDVTSHGSSADEIMANTGNPSELEIAMPVTILTQHKMLPSSSPEFPGGIDALRKFLGRNLQTPEELEEGATKIVRARFRVDKDGIVSLVEIETSAGALYDQEVIRVCKKMPRWKPAIQNGEPVSVSYVLPVTFITQ